ncbi:MAG: helix-turn-helix transcriptional regulator [Oscillospiraceae bacterium]|nr:helix-turn-helix transcriptional regulator [Oscillospiraceae bacterium]
METNIGSVICELRRKRGMTQEELAEAVGVSAPAVSKWETASSCPDVALLAPIARALDTDVNTLLSFTPTLSQEELLALLKELYQLARRDAAGTLERMRDAVRRYPTDAQLRFQLASFAMSTPHLCGWGQPEAAEALTFAREGLVFAQQQGDGRMRPLAAYILAGLLLNTGELDQAEALLDTLPSLPLSPQALYTALYQKRGDGEKARCSAQAQLAAGATAVLNSLLALASPQLAKTEADAQRAFQVYRAVSEALGYPQSQTDILLAAHELQWGRRDQALNRLLSAAHSLMEREVPHLLLWQSAVPEEQYGEYRRSLGRMLRGSLLADAAFDGVRQDERYLEALEILGDEA